MPPRLDDPTSVAAWVTDQLEDAGIPYAIGGAVALSAHGFPRTTADVDLSVFAPRDELDILFDALDRAGCLFDRADARRAIDRMFLFTVRCGRVLVDLFVSFHPHHHDALERRVALRCPDGESRWFLSAEDLAIHKLALARPKDAADLERLFAATGSDLDLDYIRRWVEAITEDGDPRRQALADLISRFASDTPSRPE